MNAAGPAGEPDSGTAARGRLVVVSGPSGVGKSSVIAALRERAPELFVSVSATTRPARAGEVDGYHYHFVDEAAFVRMISDGALLEHAVFAGHRYGTPRAPVEQTLAEGRPAVVEIELQGARQVRAAMPGARLVMLAPPTWDELVGRLTTRATERDDAVAARLSTATEELAAAEEFDGVVVNTDVGAAAAELLTWISG